MTTARTDSVRLVIWTAALAIIAACAVRFARAPSFWLDEAFVAVSLRAPSLQTIFAPLEYGQYFPRLYLSLIAAMRKAFGYDIWALRLLPFLAFIVGTVLWARLLERRSRPFISLALIGAALLLGSSYWLDQSIQLKQYTFDVMLSLIPFTVSDKLFEEGFIKGRRKALLACLALPCFLSYTYPMALAARVMGWYIYEGRKHLWRVRSSSAFAIGATALVGIISIWLTDHQFNMKDQASYLAYWNDCILGSRLQQSVDGTLRLISKFFWGWHGRMPMVTAVMVPLQLLGLRRVLMCLKNSGVSADESLWGSRSAGSIVLLGGVLLASVLLSYPICAGRVVLFTQIHTQILALEGALFIMTFWKKSVAAKVFIYAAIAIIAFHSGREFIRFTRSEPAENIRPMLALIDPQAANRVWVHPCSVAQVRALPDPLPVQSVILGSEPQSLPRSEKAWVLWTHLGDEHCRKSLEEAQSRARVWQVVHEGAGRGLALAEF